MKVLRRIVKIDDEKCDGCGLCVPACAEAAIKIIDGKARLVSESFCDGLGACLGECPNNAISIVEREAEEFDEKAVEEYLKSLQDQVVSISGCPHSYQVNQSIRLSDQEACPPERRPLQWPVKIDLVPPKAPFLLNADLLVTADCVPVVYEEFHRDFVGKGVVMLGCPKFGDAERMIQKFVQIFKGNPIKNIRVLRMEVPCCGGLPVLLKRAMARSMVHIPIEETVVGTNGEIISRVEIP